jgi:hypothetical protein
MQALINGQAGFVKKIKNANDALIVLVQNQKTAILLHRKSSLGLEDVHPSPICVEHFL